MSGEAGEFGDVGAHQVGAQRAVEADGERPGVADRVPERLDGLAGQGAAGAVGDRAGDPDRQALQPLVLEVEDRLDRGLGVQGVEDGLDLEEVDAASMQGAGLLQIGGVDLVEGHRARAGIVDVGGHRQRPAQRPDGAADEARLVRRLRGPAIGRLAGETSRRRG